MVNFQNLETVHLKKLVEEKLVEVHGKGKVEMSSHITVYVKLSIEGFIIPPFSSLLALSV